MQLIYTRSFQELSIPFILSLLFYVWSKSFSWLLQNSPISILTNGNNYYVREREREN